MAVFLILILVVILIMGLATDVLTHKNSDGFKVKMSEEEKSSSYEQYRVIVICLIVLIVFSLLV